MSPHQPEVAQFAIIRYVPDLAKGECVNIGIVWQYGGDKDVRLRDDWEKVKVLDPNAKLELIASTARGILSLVDATGKLDDSLAMEIRSTVQLGRVTPIPLGRQPIKEIIDILFHRLVEEKGSPPDLSGETYQTLREIIQSYAIADSVERGDIEGAKKAFEGVPTDRSQLESYFGVLGASQKEEDWENAHNLMQTHNVHNPRLYALFAYRWWSVGKLDRAIALSEKGLEIAEGIEAHLTIAKLKNSLAYYYADSGRQEFKDRALSFAREANGERPNEAPVLDTLGYVQIVFGATKDEIRMGIDLCIRAWKMNGPLEYLVKHLGAAHQRMKLLGCD